MNLETFKSENFLKKNRNLIIAWPVWVGKTHLATQILEQVWDKIIERYKVTDAHFKQMVKSNLLILRKPEDFGVSLEFYPLEVMLKTKILLYDDIGVSDTSDAYIRDLTYILDERIVRGLQTIFTTNLTEKELKEKLNERIVSRMMYQADIVIMKWEDRRKSTTQRFVF